jgi:hypothetical protein
MCISNEDRSAAESIADTQPQLQPALLRLSAITSQFFIRFRAVALMIMPVGFNCGFEFEKGRQLLICMHNKASSVAALCGHNPNWSAFAIHSRRKQRQIDMRGRDDASSWWTRLRTTIRSQFLRSERNPCAMHLDFLPRYWMR